MAATIPITKHVLSQRTIKLLRTAKLSEIDYKNAKMYFDSLKQSKAGELSQEDKKITNKRLVLLDKLKAGELSERDFKTVNEYPNTFRQLYITSPMVMIILENNEPLLKRLEAHFGTDRLLSIDLAMELVNNKIKSIPFTQATYFYTSSDVANTNDYILVNMELEHLRRNPTKQDIELVFSASKTKYNPEKDVSLTNEQASVLFNTVVSLNIFKLLMSAGIDEINIKPSYFGSEMQLRIINKITMLIFKQTELDVAVNFRAKFNNFLNSQLAEKGVIIPKK